MASLVSEKERRNFIMNYSQLTKKQASFVHHLFDMGHTDATNTTFKRSELKTIAEQGGWAWAPAWIVKDKTRVVNRGMYSVPELAEFIAEMQEEATADADDCMAGAINIDDKFVEDNPQVDTDVQMEEELATA
jgi:hypothetical protein